MSISSTLSIFDYLELLKKTWKSLASVVIISVLLVIFYTLLKPTPYVSDVTLLFVESGPKSGSSLGSILGLAGFAGGGSSQDIVMAILTSKRMRKDIAEHFKSYEKPLWWEIDTYPIISGLGIQIKGPDPALTKDIADFCIENFDKINAELSITPNKPMVRVLDPAGYGAPANKNLLKKSVIGGVFSFLMFALYIFFMDYIKKIKKQ